MSHSTKRLVDLLGHKARAAKASVVGSFQSLHWPSRPQALNLEITSTCDARCIHCPRQEMDRKMRPMAFDLFQKIVDEAAALQVPEFCPNGYGELMTLKELPKYLEYVASRPHRFRVSINTNGFRMDRDKAQLLVDTKTYLVNICIDGATAETAERVRPGLRFDQIEANIHQLVELRRAKRTDFPKVRVGFVVIPENRHEAEGFLERWRDKVEFVGLDGFANRGGSLDGGPAPHASHPCVYPFRDLNVWSDGKAVLCCNDWNEEYLVGDLTQQTLAEVWHGAPLKNARALHLQGRGGELPLCAKCNYWVPPPTGARLWS